MHNKLTRINKHKVGLLAIAITDEDNLCKVLFNKVIRPRLSYTRVQVNIKFSKITWGKYNSSIDYEEAIVERMPLLLGMTSLMTSMLWNTVAEFSSIVQCVYDTATNASLNQLVPTERDKPNLQTG